MHGHLNEATTFDQSRMQVNWGSETLWAAVGAISAVLTVVGSLILWVGRSIRAALTRGLGPLKAENERLRDDLDTRLRLPSFGLDAVRLTEIAAQRRIEELEREHRAAVEAKDRQLAETLREQIADADSLRKQLEAADAERNRLGSRLRQSVLGRQLRSSPHSISLPTGLILVLRHHGKYAAVQAIDQTNEQRGSLIRYVWWYNPDGGSRFTSPNTLCGYAIAGEKDPHRPPVLQVGPLRVPWSMGSDGIGWVYFSKKSVPPDGCEAALAEEIDITKVDGSKLEYRQPAKDNTGRTA